MVTTAIDSQLVFQQHWRNWRQWSKVHWRKDLSNNSIGENGAKFIGESVKELKNLQQLTLEKVQRNCLKNLQQLTLYFYGNNIGDNGAKFISNNSIGENGAKFIGERKVQRN
eukprot:TRINITY_DN215_c0_g1_i31.p4 TRINITY_DN215_c0_g1~~TRINITY_DN215_c0_g1_i31.p4  ORF type:complete len:112 (-),score=20.57 TRINITY_DN215_c0_g1_i31:118-453(-)